MHVCLHAYDGAYLFLSTHSHEERASSAAAAKSKRQAIYPLAKWYVQRELQPKVVKGKPLYAIFQMNVVQGGKLNCIQGRSAWLKAVAAATNRSKQFAQVPKR